MKFNHELETSEIRPESQDEVREVCKKFLLSTVEQTELLLLQTNKILADQLKLRPSEIGKVSFQELPFPEFMKDQEKVAEGWRKVVHMNWEEELGQKWQENPTVFWGKLKKLPVFTELAEYALAVYSLPCSNAQVERVFSIMTYVKTRLRNRIQVPMLNSILFLKSYLQARVPLKTSQDLLKMHKHLSLLFYVLCVYTI